MSGEFESASHDECICQRVEDGKKLFISVLLGEILRVGIESCISSYVIKIIQNEHDMGVHSLHPLTDAFVM